MVCHPPALTHILTHTFSRTLSPSLVSIRGYLPDNGYLQFCPTLSMCLRILVTGITQIPLLSLCSPLLMPLPGTI